MSVSDQTMADQTLGSASRRLEQTIQTLLTSAALAAAAKTSSKSTACGRLARAAALLLRRRHDDLLRLRCQLATSYTSSYQLWRDGSSCSIKRGRRMTRVRRGAREEDERQGQDDQTYRGSSLHRLRRAVTIRRLGRVLSVRLAHGLAIVLLRGIVGHLVSSIRRFDQAARPARPPWVRLFVRSVRCRGEDVSMGDESRCECAAR